MQTVAGGGSRFLALVCLIAPFLAVTFTPSIAVAADQSDGQIWRISNANGSATTEYVTASAPGEPYIAVNSLQSMADGGVAGLSSDGSLYSGIMGGFFGSWQQRLSCGQGPFVKMGQQNLVLSESGVGYYFTGMSGCSSLEPLPSHADMEGDITFKDVAHQQGYTYYGISQDGHLYRSPLTQNSDIGPTWYRVDNSKYIAVDAFSGSWVAIDENGQLCDYGDTIPSPTGVSFIDVVAGNENNDIIYTLDTEGNVWRHNNSGWRKLSQPSWPKAKSIGAGGGDAGTGSYTMYMVTGTPQTETKHTLSFNLNGPTGDAPASQELSSTQVTVEPDDPVWAGHTFDGWYTLPVGGTKFTFGQPLTEDTILYAHWNDMLTRMPSTGVTNRPLILVSTVIAGAIGLGMMLRKQYSNQ